MVEATYLLQVAPWIALQPDLQYVINPGAGIISGLDRRPIRNAVVIGMRSLITF